MRRTRGGAVLMLIMMPTMLSVLPTVGGERRMCGCVDEERAQRQRQATKRQGEKRAEHHHHHHHHHHRRRRRRHARAGRGRGTVGVWSRRRCDDWRVVGLCARRRRVPKRPRASPRLATEPPSQGGDAVVAVHLGWWHTARPGPEGKNNHHSGGSSSSSSSLETREGGGGEREGERLPSRAPWRRLRCGSAGVRRLHRWLHPPTWLVAAVPGRRPPTGGLVRSNGRGGTMRRSAAAATVAVFSAPAAEPAVPPRSSASLGLSATVPYTGVVRPSGRRCCRRRSWCFAASLPLSCRRPRHPAPSPDRHPPPPPAAAAAAIAAHQNRHRPHRHHQCQGHSLPVSKHGPRSLWGLHTTTATTPAAGESGRVIRG